MIDSGGGGDDDNDSIGNQIVWRHILAPIRVPPNMKYLRVPWFTDMLQSLQSHQSLCDDDVEPTKRREEEDRNLDVEPVDEEPDVRVSYLSKLSLEATFHISLSLHRGR